MGARYKFDIGMFFNEYEEECLKYRLDTIITGTACKGFCFPAFWENETNFNYVNDSYGHNCADVCIQDVTGLNVTDVCLKYHLIRNAD